MSISVLVVGAKGKMGSETVKAVKAEEGLGFVGEVNRGDDLVAMLAKHKPTVAVEFTNPTSVKANTKAILTAGAHALVGATGLTEADLKELESLALSKNLGVMVCPNFAIGAVLMMKLAADVAVYMPHVEITELHHDKKADAPSGTAIKTAELIMKKSPAVNPDFERLQKTESHPGARGAHVGRIPIHSVRLPGYIASQEVNFGGLGQTLTLRHDTLNRESFMPGVILAIQKIVTIKGLVYGLENVL